MILNARFTLRDVTNCDSRSNTQHGTEITIYDRVEYKNRKKSRGHKSVSSNRDRSGSIMILFTVVLLGMIGLTALALDVQRWISEKHSLQNVSDNMAISSLDCYYNNYAVNDLIVGLDVREQVEARITSGMRCAQNVFNSSVNILMDQNKMAEATNRASNPFINVNWQNRYDDMIQELSSGDHVSFPQSRYLKSAVSFLQENGERVVPSNLPEDATSELVLQSKIRFAYKRFESVQPILSQVLSGIRFQPVVETKAEVVNLNMTRSLVLAMDRSFSLAGNTVPSGNFQNLVHAVQFENNTIQPMQRLVDTAKVLPEILADQNRFREPEFNNSFGIVMFDVVAEAVEFNSGPGDLDEHLSHDEGGNGYQDVMAVLNQPVTGGEIPRLVNRCADDPICRDFRIEQEDPTCDENHDPGEPPGVNNCWHDRFLSVKSFKEYWHDDHQNGGNPYTPSADIDDLWRLRDPSKPPDRYMGTFRPWTQTDGSIGLEVAIEIIRQERERLRQLFGEDFVDKKFSGEIVAFSDLEYNTFHDRNAPLSGADPFPNGLNNSQGTYLCDSLGIVDSTVPGQDSRLYDLTVYPASWRERVTQPRAYGDLYHNGTTFFDISSGYDPDHPPVGFEPLGVETNVNTTHATIYQNAKPCMNPGDPHCCPGPDCAGNVTSCSTDELNCRMYGVTADTYAGNAIPDTSRNPLYCPDLAAMDYARWAEANEITIHVVGFRVGTGTAHYLMDYMSDPSKDGKNVGLVIANTSCSDSGCTDVERAFKKIGRHIAVKISGS